MTPYVTVAVLEPVDVGVTDTVFSAVFIAATVPSNVTVDEPDDPETRVVLPAVYDTVPALAVTVARTVSPFAHVLVLMNVEPSPKLRADDAVADNDFLKSRLLTMRDERGSNSTISDVLLHES